MQAKLVQVFQGEVIDVIVDIRNGSPTFGKAGSFILSQEIKSNYSFPRDLLTATWLPANQLFLLISVASFMNLLVKRVYYGQIPTFKYHGPLMNLLFLGKMLDIHY